MADKGMVPDPLANAPVLAWRGGPRPERRTLPEEVPVALSFQRETHAVMLATPADLEDFALGFSLSERIIDAPGEVAELAVVAAADGVELRMWLHEGVAARLRARRRRLAGPTGCGLCGLDSLAEAVRPPPFVASAARVTPGQVIEAMAALPRGQALNRASRALHAAGLFVPGRGLVAVREDVGRHNAVDKLVGALARAGRDAACGILALSSRVSVELVQKAARLGVPVLAAVSVPTALAVRVAEASGITLVGVARGAEFEVFSRPERVDTAPPGDTKG